MGISAVMIGKILISKKIGEKEIENLKNNGFSVEDQCDEILVTGCDDVPYHSDVFEDCFSDLAPHVKDGSNAFIYLEQDKYYWFFMGGKLHIYPMVSVPKKWVDNKGGNPFSFKELQ